MLIHSIIKHFIKFMCTSTWHYIMKYYHNIIKSIYLCQRYGNNTCLYQISISSLSGTIKHRFVSFVTCLIKHLIIIISCNYHMSWYHEIPHQHIYMKNILHYIHIINGTTCAYNMISMIHPTWWFWFYNRNTRLINWTHMR